MRGTVLYRASSSIFVWIDTNVQDGIFLIPRSIVSICVTYSYYCIDSGEKCTPEEERLEKRGRKEEEEGE